jgi:hypothetical protein
MQNMRRTQHRVLFIGEQECCLPVNKSVVYRWTRVLFTGEPECCIKLMRNFNPCTYCIEYPSCHMPDDIFVSYENKQHYRSLVNNLPDTLDMWSNSIGTWNTHWRFALSVFARVNEIINAKYAPNTTRNQDDNSGIDDSVVYRWTRVLFTGEPECYLSVNKSVVYRWTRVLFIGEQECCLPVNQSVV